MKYSATIIIPLLRQVDDWLQDCVKSALHQTVPVEVVVIRSKLTPASNLQVLDRLQRENSSLVVLLRDDARVGCFPFPCAIDKGIRHARADRIGLLLSDDWLDPSTVAACLPNDADIVSTRNTIHFPDGSIYQRAKELSLENVRVCPTLESKARHLQHFFLFRKQTLVEAGGLDETIGDCPGIDDFDLIWTLLERNATVSIVEKYLYHYRDHDGDRLTLRGRGYHRPTRSMVRKADLSDDEEELMLSSLR